MAKVTSKYQVTLPKAIADKFKIRPGDDIHWVPAGDVIRVIPPGKQSAPEDRESWLRVFDQDETYFRPIPLPLGEVGAKRRVRVEVSTNP